MRFHLSNMDTMLAEKGTPYRQLPDLYAVFISEIDPFQQDCTIYHVRRSLQETDTTIENGVHEIYANTAVNDGTDIAQLLQYFKHTTDTNVKARFSQAGQAGKIFERNTGRSVHYGKCI